MDVPLSCLALLALAIPHTTPYFDIRFLTLLDPTYAKKFIPIVASVSEHQPTTWASFAFDLHVLVFAGEHAVVASCAMKRSPTRQKCRHTPDLEICRDPPHLVPCFLPF